MAVRRTRGGASTAQVIDFFGSADAESLQVIDYFKTAELAKASAALAIASTIVKDRQAGQAQEAAPARTRRATAAAPAPEGASAPRAGRPPSTRRMARGEGNRLTDGSRRVIGGAAPTADADSTAKRVVGEQTNEAPQT